MRLLKSGISFRVSSLILPGDFRKRLDSANLDAIRASVVAGKVLPPIRVSKANVVVFGFHRVAAHLDAKAKTIRADIVEYASPAEQEEDSIAENLDRLVIDRRERDRLIARLVELRTGSIMAETSQCTAQIIRKNAENLPSASREITKPVSPKREAIRQVAKQLKRSEDTVERAVKAQESPPDDDETPAAPEPTDIPPCLDWFDLEPDRDVDGQARKIQAQVAEADKILRSLRRLITGLRELGVPNAVCQLIEADYEKLAHGVRRSKPKSACLYCKGRVRSTCYPCGGLGWMSEAQVGADVPAPLRARGADAMVSNGNGGFRPVNGSGSF